MKANKKFIEADDHAVSAVIGVILMVAITVAIAATVYYYVTVMMPTTGQSTPTFSLRVDDQNDRLIVSSSDPKADWNRLAMKANKGDTDGTNDEPTVLFRLNADVISAWAWPTDPTVGPGAIDPPVDGPGYPLPINILVEITNAVNPMSATEFIDFEGYEYATPDDVTVPEVTFTIVDTTANAEIGTFTFLSIAAMTPAIP